VRGHEYSFANSNYLQAELAKRHIAYRYVPELAPTQDMRELQNSADAEAGVSIRRRRKLSEEFKRRYTAEVLGRFDSRSFIENFRGSAERAALFCVEGEAGACHRSLAAKKLHVDLKLPVEHL
jgi:hypothetical protein